MPYKKTKLSTLTKGNSIFFNGKRLFPCRLLNWNTDRVKFSGHANFSILTDSVSHFSNALESFGLLFCRLFFFNLCLLILFSFKCSKVESCSAYILQNFRDSTWSFLSSTVQILYLRGNDVDTLRFGRSSTVQISNTRWKKEI